VRHVDLVIECPSALNRMLSKAVISRHVPIFRRPSTTPRMHELFAGLPKLSQLTLNLNVDKDSPLETALSAVWPTLAPRLLGLHIHVHGLASCAPFLSLNGDHLVQLLTLRITYDQALGIPFLRRPPLSTPHITSKVTENIAYRMAKLAGGAQRTMKSLRIDFVLDSLLRPELFLQELARHHFVELSSLHFTLPGF
jgi:hypothetical protein